MLSRAKAVKRNKVAERRAIKTKNGIEIYEVISIGGIQQFINIRGKDFDNPVLLFVHGGPRHVMTPIAHSFQDSWEDDFTVAQWDQRNAGKTYFLNDPLEVANTMSVERMTEGEHMGYSTRAIILRGKQFSRAFII